MGFLEIAVHQGCRPGRQKRQYDRFEVNAFLEFIESTDAVDNQRDERRVGGNGQQRDQDPGGWSQFESG